MQRKHKKIMKYSKSSRSDNIIKTKRNKRLILFVLLLVRGYLEGALNRESSSGSRGGGSRWCRHELD